MSHRSLSRNRTAMSNEGASVSRATSLSRASKHGSTVSRNQSLIKKNVAPHDLRPSDVLIERFVAWKAILKQLIAYFEVRLQLVQVLSCENSAYNLGLSGHRRYREQHRQGVHQAWGCHPGAVSLRQSVPGRRRSTGVHLFPRRMRARYS